MDAFKLKRELEALDALERRIRQLHAPSGILLKNIADKRAELLNPVDARAPDGAKR